MTTEETIKIMAVLRVAYPAYYSKISDGDARATVALWSEMFADEPYELVGAAVKAFIASDTAGYPPNIGKIKDAIHKLTDPEEMTEQEAATMILKAAGNSAYHAAEEFEKLPAICRQLVGNPQQLRIWSQMDADTVHSVIASNLQRSYKVLVQRDREIKALPASVKQFIDSHSIKLLE